SQLLNCIRHTMKNLSPQQQPRAVRRREFLRKSGLAISLAPFLGGSCMSLWPRRIRAAEPGANDKVRLGVIGCGGRGRDVLGVFLSNKEVDCPVVCDVDDRMLARAATDVEEKRGHPPVMVRDF